MNREITDHRVGIMGDKIKVLAIDPPDDSGASHAYEMRFLTPEGLKVQPIKFQQGPLGPGAIINGTSVEAVVAIAIDRLRGFQGINSNKTGVAGKFPTKENACALTHLEEALLWLHKRTMDRMARNVEGKTMA